MNKKLKIMFMSSVAMATFLFISSCANDGGESVSSSETSSSQTSSSSSSSEEPLPPSTDTLSVTGGKRSFIYGESFSSVGLVVTLNGEDARILTSDEYEVDSSSYAKYREGEHEIVVYYKLDRRVRTTYSVTVAKQYTLTFQGLGVNSAYQIRNGDPYEGEIPVPARKFYKTSYSIGGVPVTSIDYSRITGDTLVSYSLLGNHVEYDEDSDEYIFEENEWGYTILEEGNNDFTASFRATASNYNDAVIGFYLEDANENPFQISICGSVNFRLHKEIESYYGGSAYHNMGGNYGFISGHLTRDIKLRYINANETFYCYVDGVCRATYTLAEIESVLNYSHIDMSSFKLGMSDYKDTGYSYTVSNFSFKQDSATSSSTQTFTLDNKFAPVKGHNYTLSNTNGSFSLSSKIKIEVEEGHETDLARGKPGFVLYDRNGKALYIYEWDNGLLVNHNEATNTTDPASANTLYYPYGGTVKDASHRSQVANIVFNDVDDSFLVRIETYATDNYNSDPTNIFNVVIPLSDIEDRTSETFDFSKSVIALYRHNWGDSDFTVTDVSLSKNNTYHLTFFGNNHNYLNTASDAVYLKTRLNITEDHQGITVKVGDQNAQIGFQNNGYSVLQDYGWVKPNKLDDIFHFNNHLGFSTATHGEHEVEYYIIEGQLYLKYDGNNYFDKPVNLYEINDAFTSNANYIVGLCNYDNGATLDAAIEEVSYGVDAYNKYNAVIDPTAASFAKVNYDSTKITLKDSGDNTIANGSYQRSGTALFATVSSTANKNVELLSNNASTGTSTTNGNATYSFELGEENINLTTKNKAIIKENLENTVYNATEPDQSILYDGGLYYRTIWHQGNENASGNARAGYWGIKTSPDLVNWSDETIVVDFRTVPTTVLSFGDFASYWAPDIIKFNNKYYIVGTVPVSDHPSSYYSNGYHLALVVYRADSPLGTYELISKQCTSGTTDSSTWTSTLSYSDDLGYLTPYYQNCIDATIYVQNGVPYLVYSDEWTNYGNSGVGRYLYAELSDDLTHIVSAPAVLFIPADFIGCSIQKTTDAVTFYKASTGDLLAIYTTFDGTSWDTRHYCVNYARSSNGSISGTWSRVGVLYGYGGNTIDDPYDGSVNCEGGHASIVNTIEGQLYMAIHLHQGLDKIDTQPNWNRHPAYIAVKESGSAGNTQLVWGLNTEKALVQDLYGLHYHALATGEVKEVDVSFNVHVEDNVASGLSFRLNNGNYVDVHVDNAGKIYVNSNQITTITSTDRYAFVFSYANSGNTFTLTVNGTDISNQVKSVVTSIKEIGLSSIGLNDVTRGKAAFFNVSSNVDGQGEVVNPTSIYSSDLMGNASIYANKATINGNGYAYLDQSSNAIYLKTKMNITKDHQGISVKVGDENAQIGFQNKGFSVLQDYGWVKPNKLDNIFHFNNHLGFATATQGEHEVEYFIIEGKLYVTYDGLDLLDKPLNLYEINDNFTFDANYSVAIYNFDSAYTFEASIFDAKFGTQALKEFNSRGE